MEDVPRAYLTFLVKDLDRSVDFYREAFDVHMVPARNTSGRELALGDTGRTVFAVVTSELMKNPGFELPTYVSREAPEARLIILATDLEAAVAKATNAGAVLVDLYRTRLENVARFSDPDGFLIELRQPVGAPLAGDDQSAVQH